MHIYDKLWLLGQLERSSSQHCSSEEESTDQGNLKIATRKGAIRRDTSPMYKQQLTTARDREQAKVLEDLTGGERQMELGA